MGLKLLKEDFSVVYDLKGTPKLKIFAVVPLSSHPSNDNPKQPKTTATMSYILCLNCNNWYYLNQTCWNCGNCFIDNTINIIHHQPPLNTWDEFDPNVLCQLDAPHADSSATTSSATTTSSVTIEQADVELVAQQCPNATPEMIKQALLINILNGKIDVVGAIMELQK
jgi:NACalpha-BTF3-like transcription factor